MDYSLFTEQQLEKRFYTLPDNIRGVLESEKEIEVVKQICRSHHIVDEEKTLIVEQLVGLILLGFVQVDDLSREISENIHLNRQHSGDIASEIDRKIFGPIRNEIEKVYAPPVEEKLGEVQPPKIEKAEEEVVDLRIEKKPETGLPKIISAEEIPEVKLPKKEIQYKEVEPPKISRQYGEVRPPKLEEDKPKIIHEEKKILPLADARKRSLGGLFGFLKKEGRDKRKEESLLPVKVELETKESFKKAAEPEKPPIIAKTEVPKPRVVHYSELRTPLPFGEIKEEREKGKEEGIIREEREKGKEESKEIKPPENLPTVEADLRGLKQNIEADKRGLEAKSPRESEPSPPKSALEEEDVIDLRTFEKVKKINR